MRQLGQLVIGCPLADRPRGAVGPELRWLERAQVFRARNVIGRAAVL